MTYWRCRKVRRGTAIKKSYLGCSRAFEPIFGGTVYISA